MNTLRLQKPKNIRFPVELDNRIEQLSQRYRVSKSDLIRQALAHQLPIWEQNGIKLIPIMRAEAS